jgi:hypothetical protein
MSTYTISLSITEANLPQLLTLAAKQGISVSMTAAPAVALVSSASAAEPQKGAKKAKKEKKAKDPNAPKREPNEWVKFTSRVRAILKADMEGQTTTNKKGETVARVPQPKEVTQTASALKERMGSISDEEILEAFRAYEANPPAVSKMVLNGQDAASRKARSESKSETSSQASAADSEDEAESEEPKTTEKPKRKWSEEAKKAAAAKRAAKKAAKEGSEPAATAAAPEVKAAAPPAAPQAAEDDDGFEREEDEEEENPLLAFAPWQFKKQEYLKNVRGDVLTTDMQWVGRYDEAKKGLNKNFPCPEDLGL